jgi:hypothetical protein
MVPTIKKLGFTVMETVLGLGVFMDPLINKTDFG